MNWLTEISHVWHYTIAGLTLFIALVASGHAILHKRDSRAATLWVAFIWLMPLIGAVFYLLLGINRIRRRATLLRGRRERFPCIPISELCQPQQLEQALGGEMSHLAGLARLTNRIVGRPLAAGNRITPLVNGDTAFPAMLEAIERAEKSVAFGTYIFDRGQAGRQFVQALSGAVKRGVQVRVLVDATGARYSLPTIVPLLRRAGVPVAQFLPTIVPWRMMSINLRNHRKLLVVDGKTAFTGGMNIRDGHLIQQQPSRPVRDVHFRIEGPVVTQLQEVFADDWLFTTKESLEGEAWFPRLECQGPVIARGIPDGPDEDFEKLVKTILGALNCAQSRIQIVTPYFLPDRTLISALNLAALRGVEVDIILPRQSNLPFVHWATFSLLWQVLGRGCRVWLTEGPFDHSKLMVVDGHWSLIGSANWDQRSLRLNFEFNMECYSREFASDLETIIQSKLAKAHRLTLKEMDSRSLPIRLRDGMARLLTPYL